jgi:hypothetical protein
MNRRRLDRTLTLILNTQTIKQSLSSQVENKREKKIQMEMELISKEFVKNCPYCGSSNIENTEREIKCLDCTMGKYKEDKDGKRK